MAFFIETGRESNSSGRDFRVHRFQAAFGLRQRFCGLRAKCNGPGPEPMVVRKGVNRRRRHATLFSAGTANGKDSRRRRWQVNQGAFGE
jgi:hypothetical protein